MSACILVTGGTAGLGYHCAIALARQYPNHRITIASRSDTQDAAGSINRLLGQTNVQYMRLDLSSLSQTRLFVKKWVENNNLPITHLLFNAGLQFPHGVSYTEDGYEKTFAINHLGHALLFSLLTPHLAQTARIVVTASGTHDPAQKTGMPDAKYTTAEELAHPSGQALHNPGRQRYTTSKLTNVLWAYALERRLADLRSDPNQGRNWTVAAFDPGLVPGTGLARDAGAVMRFAWTRVLPKVLPVLRALVSPNIHSAEESGRSLAWLAGDGKVIGSSGLYYEGRKDIKSSEESYERAKQEDLWEWTVRNVAEGPEEIALFSLKTLV
ncbi:short-chain dehydrogenase [Aspergillus cavernicola]|uniref:Short-chain dehydrogenase n=1 Tax=Aspergillus cavernicola TaxID=176166 RepID=A0ABR4IHD0_9EURO